MSNNKIMRLSSAFHNSWIAFILFFILFFIVMIIMSLISYWIPFLMILAVIIIFFFDSSSTIKYVGMDDEFIFVKRIFKDQQKIPLDEVRKIYKGFFNPGRIYVQLKNGKEFSFVTTFMNFVFGAFTEAMEGEEYSLDKLKRQYLEWSKGK